MASRDLPFMVTPELLGLIMQFARAWGEGNSAIFLAPSLAVSAEGRQLWRDIERSCGDSVHAPEVIERETEVDVVELLPSVDVPTLVLHRVNEQFVPPQAARYLANAIRGARLVHLDGMDHFPWMGDSQAVVREIKVFITGELRPDEPSAAMTAVLITDIVGSTELVIGMGDRRWNETLQRHDEIAAGEVDAAGGKLVKSTGDGVLAVFDHPAQAVSCAVALRDAVQPLGLDIRCGVTVGEVTFRPTDVTGVSVHIAERLANLCRPGQILVSRGVRVLLAESEFNFVGLRPLKGVPGGRSVFELTERGQGTSA
jgi:class 3 adenylate cyclase